jgi:hypothetical protein
MFSTTNRIAARAGVFSLVAMLCLSVACDDTSDDMGSGETDTTGGDGDGDSGDGDGDGDGDGALSYAADIQPIWDASCTTGCHTAGGIAELFVVLSGDSYGNIVGVLSGQATDKQLIEVGNSANSYMIAKLRGTQVDAGGSGGPMPGGVNPVPLPEATIVLIEQWIDGGALP